VIGYVADTHALFWYLINSPRLGPRASLAFDEADQGAAQVFVPAIVLAELFYLNDKLGGQLDFPAEIQRLRSSSQFVLVPFLPEDVSDFDTDQAVTEMHDRIIAGVARRLNATLLTRDSQIAQSNLVPTRW
jgi:PIN domain nuclease of toxin-antitoxin system